MRRFAGRTAFLRPFGARFDSVSKQLSASTVREIGPVSRAGFISTSESESTSDLTSRAAREVLRDERRPSTVSKRHSATGLKAECARTFVLLAFVIVISVGAVVNNRAARLIVTVCSSIRVPRLCSRWATRIARSQTRAACNSIQNKHNGSVSSIEKARQSADRNAQRSEQSRKRGKSAQSTAAAKSREAKARTSTFSRRRCAR